MSEDSIIMSAKNAPRSLSRSTWYAEIFKRSEQQRPVGESQHVAFTRFIEKHPDGQVLYRAYKVAPGPEWQPPERAAKAEEPRHTVAMTELKKLGEEIRDSDRTLTPEQAFVKAMETPRGREPARLSIPLFWTSAS
jgi:hypothetical protein